MPESTYLRHVLVWMIPLVALQWAVGWRILLQNRRAIVIPPLLTGTYYILTDIVAIRSGIWSFDESRLLGVFVFDVPVEEILFFFLTALLVAQSLVLFLPPSMRHGRGG